MRLSLARFRSLSTAAYTCLFCAGFGALFFGVASPEGILYLWLAIGAVGVVLALIKDVAVEPLRVRTGLLLADALTVAALLLLASALPSFLGLVRGLLVIALAAAHGAIYSRLLYSERIITWEA
jgi:hypothetical protein